MDSLRNLLEDLLEYGDEGLSIDIALAQRIRYFLDLEIEKENKEQSKKIDLLKGLD